MCKPDRERKKGRERVMLQQHQQQLAMKKQRCMGVLLGVCAGDRNGGPLRMAHIVLETAYRTYSDVLNRMEKDSPPLESSSSSSSRSSIIDEATSTLVVPNIAREYLRWYSSGNAFDYGSAFHAVFSNLKCIEDLDTVVTRAHEKTNSAGANPSHRNCVLSMLPALDSYSSLANAARREAKTTHLHPAATETSVAVNIICRELIMNGGGSFDEAIDVALRYVDDKEENTLSALRRSKLFFHRDAAKRLEALHHAECELHRGGYSPGVLEAALYFLSTTTTFTEALHSSISFAGPANYCPVLVGALAGAFYGASSIDEADLKHRMLPPELRLVMEDLADVVSSHWH